MIGRHYKAHRDNVIDIFNAYKIKRGGLDDGVDIKFLENRIEKLKNGKFTLAVAGEVKAGKSTFINALLGKEILPSDVLQASCAIVEIFKSKNSFLKVKYADDNEELIYDDLDTPDIDEANVRLHEICKINDEYREIPTAMIDNYIVESDKKIKVDDVFIRELEQKSGEHLQNKQSVIENYILKRTKDNIPVEIEFGYPLKWDFDELRIVDSPGVNATGGVQDVSFRFFEEANAILFVHPIKPIESESFRKFVNSTISNRSQEMLFLILTHSGLYPNNEVERLHKEAARLYSSEIPQSRILVVDSLLKLIHCDLDNGVSIKEIRKSENKRKILSSYREQAEDEGKDLIDVVYESSRFEKMFSAIDEFSMRAPNLQLQEILVKIRNGYGEQEKLYIEKANILEKKKKSPQEFENEINRISDSLDKYKYLMHNTKVNIENSYVGRHSTWQKDIDSLKVTYPELITNSNSIESVRKNFLDAINAVNEKVDNFSRELTIKLENTLEETGKSFLENNQITLPLVDLNSIEGKAKKNAYRNEDVYEDRPFDKWDYIGIGIPRFFRENRIKKGTRKVFDEEKFIGEYKSVCNAEFYKMVNYIPSKSKEVLDIYLDMFLKEIGTAINERQKALEHEKTRKQTNDELISEINELWRKKNDIKPEKSRCIEVLEDIK